LSKQEVYKGSQGFVYVHNTGYYTLIDAFSA